MVRPSAVADILLGNDEQETQGEPETWQLFFIPIKNIHYCIEIQNPVLFEACRSNDVTTPVTLLAITSLDNLPRKSV